MPSKKKEDANELILKIKQNGNRVTDVENSSMVTRGFPLVKREAINWETGIDICALLYIKLIINKDLLYSKGNYN